MHLALNEPISAELHKSRITSESQYVSEQVRAQLFEQYGEEVYKAGLKVYTTIDGELQAAANEALRRALLDYDRRHGYRGVIDHIDLATVIDDPFDEDLVSDDRVGGLRKGIVVAINEAQKPVPRWQADDALPPGATLLISNFEQIHLPFKTGIEWARPFVDVNRAGAGTQDSW